MYCWFHTQTPCEFTTYCFLALTEVCTYAQLCVHSREDDSGENHQSSREPWLLPAHDLVTCQNHLPPSLQLLLELSSLLSLRGQRMYTNKEPSFLHFSWKRYTLFGMLLFDCDGSATITVGSLSSGCLSNIIVPLIKSTDKVSCAKRMGVSV